METTNTFAFDFLDSYHVHKDIITNRNFTVLDSVLCNNMLISRRSTVLEMKKVRIGDMYFIPEIGRWQKNSENDKDGDKHSAEKRSDGDGWDDEANMMERLWKEHNGQIACYVRENEWHFIKLRTGMLFFILDEKILSIFYDDKWQDLVRVGSDKCGCESIDMTKSSE